MRYGMNLLLWTDVICEEARPLVEEIKSLGFDAVELPVFENDVDKYARWGKYLDAAGLARTGVTIRGAEDDPMSADAKIRRKGIDANKAALDCCEAAGIEALVGPFHSALGCFSGAGPTADEWRRAVDSMRETAEYAEKRGVTLAVEYLNRFECYLLNCATDGARFVREVDHPRCKMMYDTFHSHIEEKNAPAAIWALKDCLVHVHISENDRSTPGAGNVRWRETFDTLQEIGYDNLLVIEAFGLALEKIVPATKIWRRMYESELQLAREGLDFMKAEVEKRRGK
ncbi:MAG: sugar phosphate isomerase/epimerase [Pirellulales bacterium]|nr:sugar phosphate isomerase/epimerase [Pirellulales bacterium]